MPNFPTSTSSELDLLIPKNNVFVTLGANIGTSDAVIPVDSTAALPASGLLTFEDDTFEIIKYTGKTPTSLTGVTRGYDGTGAAAHNGGVTIGMYWVAAYHTLLANEIIAIETNLANRIGLSSNQVQIPSGTGSLAPALTISGEATGLFGGSGVLGLAAGGAEIAHLDSLGLTVSQGKKIGVGYEAGLRSNGYSITPSEGISIGNGLGYTSYGVLELVGMKTGANIPVGTISFLNKAIGTADDRIADISATLYNGDHIGQLLFTVWDGAARTYFSMTHDYFAPLQVTNLGDSGARWGTVYATSLDLSGGFSITKVLLEDGDAANPSLTFGLDQNLGLLRVANDTLGVSTGGILRAVFSNSGYFGLGTATPASLFEGRADANNAVSTLATLTNLGQSTTGPAGAGIGFDIATDNAGTRLSRAGSLVRDAAGTMTLTNKAGANGAVTPAVALRIAQEGAYPIEFYTGGVLRSSISGFSPVWKIYGNEPIHAEGAQPIITLKDTATSRTTAIQTDNGKLILKGGVGGNDLTINHDGSVQTAGQIFATDGIIPVLPNQSLGNSGQKWNDAFFATAHIDTLVISGGAVTAIFVEGQTPMDGDVVLIPGTGIAMTQTALAKTIQIDNDGLLSLGLHMGGAGLKGAVTLEAGDNITLTQNGPGNRIKIDAAGAATMTWPLLAPNGNVSAPSYSFENLPTWGWYADPGENSIEMAVDGADYLRARKYLDGVKLGLGGISPIYMLDIMYQSDQTEEEAEMFRLANYRQSTGYQYNGIMMSFDIALNNTGSKGQVARIDRFFDGQFRILNSAGQFHSSHTKNALTSFEGTEGVARIGINTGNHWISINDQGFIGLDGTPPSAPAGTNLATPQSLLQFGKVSGTHNSMIEILGSGSGTYGVLAFTNGTKSKARIEAVDQGNYGDLRIYFGTGASTEAYLDIMGTQIFPEILPSTGDTFELGKSDQRFRTFYGVRSITDYVFANQFIQILGTAPYYVQFSAQPGLQSQPNYKWGADGTAGQVLTTDGAGNLSWGALQISYPLIAPNGDVANPQFGFNTYEGGKTGFFYDPSNTNPRLGIMYGNTLYNQEIASFSSHQQGETVFTLSNGTTDLTTMIDTSNRANISVGTGKTMRIFGTNSMLEFKDNYIDFTGLAIRPAGNGALGDSAHWFGQVYGGTVNTQNLTIHNSGKTHSMQWTYTGGIDSDPYLWPALGNVGQVLRRGAGLNGPLEWADVGGSGTVNAGTASHIAYYPGNGAAVSSSQYITIEGGGVVNFPSGFRISNQQPIYLNYGGGTAYPKMTYSAAASALFFATMNSNSDKTAYLASEGAIHLYANVNQDGSGSYRPHVGLNANGSVVIDSAYTAPSANQYLQLQFAQAYVNNTFYPIVKMYADNEFLEMGYVGDGTTRKAARIISTFGPLELSGATSVKIQGSLWPTTVGSNGQMLKTDGAGQLSWANVATVNAGTSPSIAYYSSANSIDAFDGIYCDAVTKWTTFPYNGIRTHNGTAAAPTHGFFNQTNKGMYSPQTDWLGFSTVATYRMYLDDAGNLGLKSGKQFRLHDDDDSNYIAFVAPAGVLTQDYVYTLPSGYGTSGQVLTTNGAGVLSWTTVSGGGGSGTVNPGIAGSFAYYAASGTVVDDAPMLSTDGTVISFTGGLRAPISTATPAYSFTGQAQTGLDYQAAGGPFPARMGLAFAGVQKMWFTSTDILLKDSTKMWIEGANDTPSIKFGVDYAGAGISGGRSPDELKFWIGQTPVNVGGVDYLGVYGNYLGMRHTNGFQTRIKTAAITADKTFTWPAGYGSANQMLTTDGAGNLSWQAAGGTSGTIVPATTPWTFAIYSGASEISNLENIMGYNGSNIWIKTDTFIDQGKKAQYGVVGNYIWRNGSTSKMEIVSSDGLKIQSVYFPAGDGTSGQALVTDGAGNLSFATVGGSSGANAALSNLAAVAINTALLPDTTNTKDIGSQTKSFRNIFGTGLTTNALAFRAAGAGSAIAPAIDYDGNATGLFWINNELHYTKDGTDIGELGAGGASLGGNNYFTGFNQFDQPVVINAAGTPGAYSGQMFIGSYGSGNPGWINMLWEIPTGDNWVYTVPNFGGDAAFVMTRGTQSIAGQKTFSDAMYFRASGDARTIIRPSRIDLWYHEQTYIYSNGNGVGFVAGATGMMFFDSVTGLDAQQSLFTSSNKDLGKPLQKWGNTYIGGTLNVGAYTLPNTDGTAGQILQTDGAGALTWQSVGGGVTYPLLAPMDGVINLGFTGTTPVGLSSNGEGSLLIGSAAHNAIEFGNLQNGAIQIVFSSDVAWTSFDSSGDLQNPAIYYGPTGEVGSYITDGGKTFNFSAFKTGAGAFIDVISFNGEKVKIGNQLHINSVSAVGAPPVLLGPTGIVGIGIVETVNPKGSLQYTADSGATYDDVLTWGASGINVLGVLTVQAGIMPSGYGTAGQVLTTDGAGNISWQNAAGGVTFPLAVPIDGTTAQLTFGSRGDTGFYDQGPKLVFIHNGEMAFEASYDGYFRTRANVFPANDGSAGQVLTTDGSGNASWQTPSSGGVTFPLSAPQTMGTTPQYTFVDGAGHGMYFNGSSFGLTFGGNEFVVTDGSATNIQAPYPGSNTYLRLTAAGFDMAIASVGGVISATTTETVFSVGGTERARIDSAGLKLNGVAYSFIGHEDSGLSFYADQNYLRLSHAGVARIDIGTEVAIRGTDLYIEKAGTASDLSLYIGTGDEGFFMPALNSIGVSISSVEIARFDSNGISIPMDVKLVLNGANVSAYLSVESGTERLGFYHGGSIQAFIYGSMFAPGNGSTTLGDSMNPFLETWTGTLFLSDRAANKIGFKSPEIAADYLYTWAANYGTAGQVLTTDGAGNLSWTTVGGGGGGVTWPLTATGYLDMNNNQLRFGNTGEAFIEFDPVLGGLNLQSQTGLVQLSTNGAQFIIAVDGSNSFAPAITLDAGISALQFSSSGGPVEVTLSGDGISLLDGKKIIFSNGQVDPKATAFLYYDSANSYLKGQTWLDGTDQSFDLWSDGEIGLYNATGTAIAILANGDITIASVTSRVKINNQYHLPAIDGTSGQVISTDGAGNLSWASAPTPSFIGAPTPESYLYTANALDILTMDGSVTDEQGSGNPGTFVQLSAWTQLRIPGNFNGQGSRIPFAFDDGMSMWDNGFSYSDSGSGASINIVRAGNPRIQVFENYVSIGTLGDPNGMGMGPEIYNPTIYTANLSNVRQFTFDTQNLLGFYLAGNQAYYDGDGNHSLRGNLPGSNFQGIMYASGTTDRLLMSENGLFLENMPIIWAPFTGGTTYGKINSTGSGLEFYSGGMGHHWFLGIDGTPFEVMYISDNKEFKFGDQNAMMTDAQWQYNYDPQGDTITYLGINNSGMAQTASDGHGTGILFGIQTNMAATISRTSDGAMRFNNYDNMVGSPYNRAMFFEQAGTVGGGDPDPYFQFGINSAWRVRINDGGLEINDGKEIHFGTAADLNVGGRIKKNGLILELRGPDSMLAGNASVDIYPGDATLGFRIDENTTAGETNVQLWVGGTLVRATVGAADSGGTGFRQLIVPN